MSISATIKSVQDIMRQDAGVDGDAQRISQLVWMLFLKVFDSKEKEWDALSDDYAYIIPDGLRWSDWAEDDEGITGDELIDFVNNTLFKTFKDWQLTEASDPKAVLVKSLFEDSYNYMKSGTLMRSVINKLNEIDFDKASDRHLFNDIYENILKDLRVPEIPANIIPLVPLPNSWWTWLIRNLASKCWILPAALAVSLSVRWSICVSRSITLMMKSNFRSLFWV